MLCRSQTTLGMQFADLLSLKIENQGVSECVSLVATITFGKTNQQGKIEYGSSVRHRQVEVCSACALAMNLFLRFHYENEPFTDFTSRDKWYEIYVVNSPFSPVHYSTQYKAYTEAFKRVGVITSKVTHANRKSALNMIENYYSNETLEETIAYQPDPLDFIVEKSGDIYYGKRLLFITRLRGAPPGIANLDAHICYLTLILSNKHLTQRLTNQDTENLNRIIEDTTVWMNKERPSEEELVVKPIQVKQQTHLILSRLLVLPFRRLKFVSKIYYDKCDLKLVKDLRRQFGNDPVLIVGD